MKALNYQAEALAVGTYLTPWMQCHDEGHTEQSVIVLAGGITGTTTIVDITPQFTYDKVNVLNQPLSSRFTQIDTASVLPYAETKNIGTNGLWVRYKIDVGGDGTFTGLVQGAAKEGQ